MAKWLSETIDVRRDASILQEAIAFLDRHGARRVVMADRIIGCPHEQGIDYQGSTCPRCPFWASRDRWTGESIE